MNSQGNSVYAHSGHRNVPLFRGDDPKASSFYKPQGGEMLAEALAKMIRSRSMVMSVLENLGACR